MVADMKPDEAEKLARKILTTHSYKPVRAVCEYILSGSMKREIENAAFERAAKLVEQAAADPSDNEQLAEEAAEAFNSGSQYRQTSGRLKDWNAVIAKHVRSLIQPSAQKEDGK